MTDTPYTFKQGDEVTAIGTLIIQASQRKLMVRVKPGSSWWVQTPLHEAKQSGTVRIGRKDRPMGDGYLFTIEQATKLFKIRA